ncbi:unnamed protein product [Ectocarpus sp. 6 AP-2014]
MSGALNRQLNTLAVRSKTAVSAAAAAASAASAKHHGRTPSSTARNPSSRVAPCVVGGRTTAVNNATTTRNLFSTSCRRHEAAAQSSAGDGGGRNPAKSETAAAAALSPSMASSARNASGASGPRRAVSSVAACASAPGGPRTAAGAMSPPSSSSPSLLAPAAAAYTGMANGQGGGGAGATRVDAVVVGAGQAGLSVAYHLQRAGGLRVVTLDANQEAGGAWRHRWPSLELFSTRKWSSLPGYPMFANGACEDGYPSTGEMAMYMEEYESVMKLNVVRPVNVTGVSRTPMGTFLVETDCLLGGMVARWEARTVISAAGTHASPVWPRLPGWETFRGTQIHSSQYRFADDFRGKKVAVVGSGNSGAQILAEVSAPGVASSTLWSTLTAPSFLPMGLSGKEIFDTVARLRQKQGFVREEDIPSLHSIIMQPGVIEAAERGVYDQRAPKLARLTPTGVAWEASEDGSIPGGHADVDAIIWCTGYRSNTSHLSRLGLVRPNSTVGMDGREMGETEVPGVFAVGYGNWAGVGSGSIPGSTVYAKRAAAAAVHHLLGGNSYDSSRVAVEAASTGAFSPSPSPSLWGGSGGGPSSGSSGSGSRCWPSEGRASVRASAPTATLSGAPPPVFDGLVEEDKRVSVAA